MILVTVGTQYFDELIEEVDRLAAKGVFSEPVLAQIGLSRHRPKHVDYLTFDRNLLGTAAQASLIITHAGTGSLIEFLMLGKPFIAVVNETKADNHQLEFLEQLSAEYDFCWIDSPRKLAAALPEARPARPRRRRDTAGLAADLRAWLQERCAGSAS